MYEALDLCLGCKACKTECPSSVNMAKIKAEVQAQRYAVEGTPLAARLFGHIHTINRLATPVAPLANAALRTSMPPTPPWASWSTSTPARSPSPRPPHLPRLVRRAAHSAFPIAN